MQSAKYFRRTRIAQEVTASVLALSLAAPLVSVAQDTSAPTYALEEIVVTASRRSQSSQDVAIALQAISESKLDELRIDSFDDYVSLIPGVNASGQGPGKQEVFIRGISPGRTAVRIASLGSEPSVAMYLDEAPISYAGRNIDLYATDLQRIEVLKGPQGTLFGASSQAGTLRLITRKPEFNEFSAGVTVDLSDTSGGEGSVSVEGYVNFPLIEDRLAARIAVYNVDQGGYIDNIAATRQIPLSNPGFGGTVPSTRVTADNSAFIEDDFNDAEYTGFRASLKGQINDNWDATVQLVSQTLDVEGIFEFEPDVSPGDDLNAQTFNRDFGQDDVDMVSLMVNGAIGDLDVVYNGSYTERTFEGQTDYTGYANNGPFIPYYICTPGYDSCGNPSLFTSSFFETERTVHEVRIATDSDKRLSFIGGIYYDDQQTIERADFTYPASTLVGFQPNLPIPDAFASNRNVRDPGVTFFNDFLSDREELSFFGSLSYKLSDTVTATFGARNYSIDIGLRGQSSFNFRTPGPFGNNVDATLAGQTPTELSDTIVNLNVSWNVGDDALLYVTYAEGFRSGGFNRNGGGGSGTVNIPFFFDTDNADSYELGWKTQFADNTVRLNGAIYYTDFSDLQQGVLDFSIDNSSFFDNVGDAEIKGLELDVNWAPTDALSLFGSFSYTDAELVELPPTITNISPAGSELPFAPDIQWTLGARYEREFSNFTGYVQTVAKYTDDRFSSLVEVARFPLESYTEVDASIGARMGNWNGSLYIDNLTDERGQLDVGAPDLIFRVNPIRPRTVGVRVSYDFQ
ncbi:MAG: outer membrane receptor protein involved in Fe transport [Arenicella sp.]|jgi:outer membrane receptor protein involved in Fe transport